VIRTDEPLSRHLAARTGGPCRAWAVVHDPELLSETLSQLASDFGKVLVLGSGTRTLCRDGGIDAAIVRLGTGFSGLANDGEIWRVGAAVPVPQLVFAAAAAGYAGVEDLAGTPGSFGAALLLDGGPGDGWAAIVQEATWASRGRREVTAAYADLVAARSRAIVTGALLKLRPDDPTKIRQRTLQRLRGEGSGRVPPGSWYAAPKKGSLRDVLVAAELPDVRLRQAWIPAVAPDLVVNLGGSPASDLALLHKSALERVTEKTGVELQSSKTWIGRA
jgi:UDP-N-acetylmuramate dehydrogenase